MSLKNKNRAIILVALGLLGMALNVIVIRYTTSSLLSNDVVIGLWFGVCIGLQVLGLYFMVKSKSDEVV